MSFNSINDDRKYIELVIRNDKDLALNGMNDSCYSIEQREEESSKMSAQKDESAKTCASGLGCERCFSPPRMLHMPRPVILRGLVALLLSGQVVDDDCHA